jgi:hypothetical protein
MEFTKFLQSKEGQVIISIVLGLGLATMFRKACTGKSCIVIKGPKIEEAQGFQYRINDECYKYTSYVVDCDEKASTE